MNMSLRLIDRPEACPTSVVVNQLLNFEMNRAI